MRSLGWVLIQYDSCPCKIRKFGETYTDETPRDVTGERRPSTSQGETKPTDSSVSDFLSPEDSMRHVCRMLLWRPQPRNTCSKEGVSVTSVAQSCPTLCDPTDCSTPGLPVHCRLPELTQTLSIEWVMPSNHLILCRPILLPLIFPSIRVFTNESV